MFDRFIFKMYSSRLALYWKAFCIPVDFIALHVFQGIVIIAVCCVYGLFVFSKDDKGTGKL